MKSSLSMENSDSIACRFLGVKVNPLSIKQLNSLVKKSVETNKKWIIANHNLHSLYIYHHNPKMRAFYDASDYVHIDGMPLIFFGKLLGFPLRREQRVTYADWVWSLMAESAARGWRVFYLGSKPGVAQKGASILRSRFPDLQIDTEHGYIEVNQGSSSSSKVLEKINTYQPHILMVGMGMPRQEHWILDNLSYINTNVILPSGACIDYVAGAIPTPPRWMGRIGLEWLYRLLSEPQRLWERYLLEPWFIFELFLKDVWKLQKISK